jgi:ribosomal protein S18 acetylase RimI-like enzyme
LINDFSPIENLIRAEQTRQNGQFIQKVDFENYLKKIEQKAEFVTHINSGQLAAFIGFYCNDINKKTAFITLVLTNPDFRGKGLAGSLLKSVLDIVKERGFSCCQLEVQKDNVAAVAVYKKAGFILHKDCGQSLLMKKEIQRVAID